MLDLSNLQKALTIMQQIYQRAEDKFSDSMIPICIDLVDWHTLDESFKQIILNNYEVIQLG